jgi:hypothetical protein
MSDRDAFRPARDAAKAKLHEKRLEAATYTAAEVKVLTETASKVAYALGRKDAVAEINQWIFDQQHKRGTNGHKWNAYMNVASQLRNIASQPPRDVSDAISGPGEGPGTSEPAKTPQEDA